MDTFFVYYSIALTALVIYFFYENRKLQNTVDHLHNSWNMSRLEELRSSARKVSSIAEAVLLLKKYTRDVPDESFRLKNSIHGDVYEGSRDAVLSSKTFQELLLSLGDLEEITKVGSQSSVIWRHIFHEVRSHIESIVLDTLSQHQKNPETVAQINVLYEKRIARSESLRQALKKREPL